MGWTTGAPFDIWGQKAARWHTVVGVRYHRDEVWESAFGRPLHNGITQMKMRLVREPGNPYDRNAVAIRRKGKLLGYISRYDAPGYSRELKRLEDAGFQARVAGRIEVIDSHTYPRQPLVVPADRLSADFRVEIRLSWDSHLVPRNGRPRGDVVEFPEGLRIPMVVDPATATPLYRMLVHGVCGVFYAVLTCDNEHPSALGVLVDGQRVGELPVSAQLSQLAKGVAAATIAGKTPTVHGHYRAKDGDLAVELFVGGRLVAKRACALVRYADQPGSASGKAT